MIDKEQIEEMANYIYIGLNKKCHQYEIAEMLYNIGYHKTIWHKVADGDLPKEYHEVRFVSDTGHYRNGIYKEVTNAFYVDGDIEYSIDEIIAWTELPKYKEETLCTK